MNFCEYGQIFRFDAGEDLSGADVTLVMEPRFGDGFERSETEGVSVGIVDIEINDQTFLANQYIEYTVKEKDLDYAGRWRARLKMKFSPTKELRTDWQRFTVLP